MAEKIFQYVRSRNAARHRVGYVEATIDGDHVIVGWSLCNTKSGDRFNRDYARELAAKRAAARSDLRIPLFDDREVNRLRSALPQSVRSTLYRVIDRSRRFVAKRNKELV